MKFLNYSFVFVLNLAFGFALSAQEKHFDVEFGYEGGRIEFESDGPGIDSAGVFEAEFEEFFKDGSAAAEDPGFASNFMKGDEMFSVAGGDSFFVNVNQSETFGGFLTYFNTDTNQFEATDAFFTIEDNSPVIDDMIIDQFGVSGPDSQFIVTAEEGIEIDSHVDFVISANAAVGAYGLLLNLESDNLSGELNDATSDRFWVVFNNGIVDEAVFESAVDRFRGAAIPEPSAGLLLLASIATLAVKRRR